MCILADGDHNAYYKHRHQSHREKEMKMKNNRTSQMHIEKGDGMPNAAIKSMFFAAAAAALAFMACDDAAVAPKTEPVFTLASPTLKDNGVMPSKHWFNQYGCTGENISPALNWSGAPAGTKSFAVTVFDLDGPTSSGFWHWMAYDIPAATTSIAEGSSPGKLPAGAVEANNDLGVPGWFGSCPLDGRAHRYAYTVYALKTAKLEVPAGATTAFRGFVLMQNVIGKATMTITAGTDVAEPAPAVSFSLKSPTLIENGVIPQKHWFNQFGCTGENISPALNWTGAPAETKSYAVSVFDNDAPTGSGFWHWLAYNIPAATAGIAEGSSPGKMPAGTVEAGNDLGAAGWFGSCPTDGLAHRYTYTVYALKTEKLEIPAGATPAFVNFMMQANTIAKAKLGVLAGGN
jgi:Raf kinase inhibitor-like YbhB/YbcL family protein